MKPLNVTYDNKHISALDGLRGVAILLVMIYHFFPSKFPIGWIGVDLFFVLSGFLITGILLRTKESSNYYRNYIAKRVLRIFPLYYFFLIIFFVVFSFTGFSKNIPEYDYLSNTQGWYWLYVQNWLIFFNSTYPQQDILSHFWSLAIEEQFYIFWPFVILITPNRLLVRLCIGLVVFCFILRLMFIFQFDISIARTYVFTFTRLDGLAVGSCIATMMLDSQQLKSVNLWTKQIFFIAGLGILATIVVARSFSFDYLLFATYGYSLIAIFFGASLIMILSNHPGNTFRKVAENKAFSFFGKYSYGLYIYHIPVLWILPKYLKPWTNSRLVVAMTCIGISIIIAYGSYHLIEKHFLKLKSKFSH